MHILTCHRETPAYRLNNTANVTSEEFQDEQSDLFKLKAIGKAQGANPN